MMAQSIDHGMKKLCWWGLATICEGCIPWWQLACLPLIQASKLPILLLLSRSLLPWVAVVPTLQHHTTCRQLGLWCTLGSIGFLLVVRQPGKNLWPCSGCSHMY